jgi:hypothetical protein
MEWYYLDINPTGLATARYRLGGCWNTTSALALGGDTGSVDITATEEWTGSHLQTKTITVS